MFIDTHAHIFDNSFESDFDEMLVRAKEAQVEAIYMPNLNQGTVSRLLSLTATVLPRCYACLGLHPCYIEEATYRQELDYMARLLEEQAFAGIGETGLDAYHSTDTLLLQQEVLEVHVSWAKQYDLPLILHARNTLELLLDSMERYKSQVRGVFHCFTGTYAQAKQALDLGFKLGIGGIISYKNGKSLRELIPRVPIEAWVLETDSPYLAPAGAASRRNEPSYLPLIARQVAKCLGLSVEEVAKHTRQNAQVLF